MITLTPITVTSAPFSIDFPGDVAQWSVLVMQNESAFDLSVTLGGTTKIIAAWTADYVLLNGQNGSLTVVPKQYLPIITQPNNVLSLNLYSSDERMPNPGNYPQPISRVQASYSQVIDKGSVTTPGNDASSATGTFTMGGNATHIILRPNWSLEGITSNPGNSNWITGVTILDSALNPIYYNLSINPTSSSLLAQNAGPIIVGCLPNDVLTVTFYFYNGNAPNNGTVSYVYEYDSFPGNMAGNPPNPYYVRFAEQFGSATNPIYNQPPITGGISDPYYVQPPNSPREGGIKVAAAFNLGVTNNSVVGGIVGKTIRVYAWYASTRAGAGGSHGWLIRDDANNNNVVAMGHVNDNTLAGQTSQPSSLALPYPIALTGGGGLQIVAFEGSPIVDYVVYYTQT